MRRVQDLVVTAPGEMFRDDEGRWRPLGKDRVARGLLRLKGLAGRSREVRPEDLGQAFAQVPLETEVATEYLVWDVNPSPEVAGEWAVVAVTRGRSFWRLELRRPGKQ